MISQLNRKFSIIPKDDHKQKLRVRRGLYALMGGFFHTLFCILLLVEGVFRITTTEFVFLFSGFWVVHVSLFLCLRLGINKKFKDPSLTLPMILWGISCVMLTVYLSTELRTALLMFYLLSLVFGVFHLEWRQFLLVNLYGLFLYLWVLISLYYFEPLEFKLKIELAVFFSFVLVSFSFGAICAEINSLRSYLRIKNDKLSSALEIIESVSMTDELTKIKNRRFILSTLENQRLMVERGNYFFSVCMIDIDHFKNVNDTYGHNIGDEILKGLCDKIVECLRKIDYFARYGGEEFLLVLPLTNLEHAKLSAERLRKIVEKTNFDHIIPNFKITLSIGVTEFQWPEEIENLLARVDVALYAAKRHGRNQVITG